MTDSPLDRLTPREREVLLAYFRHAHRGVAATALGISENTLKTHLNSARKKLAMPDASIVALLFPSSGGPHPKWASPHRGIGNPDAEWLKQPVDPHSAATSGPLRDVIRVEEQHRDRWETRRNDLSTLPRIVLIAVATLAFVAALILAFSFSDGVQRWANVIATPTKQ